MQKLQLKNFYVVWLVSEAYLEKPACCDVLQFVAVQFCTWYVDNKKKIVNFNLMKNWIIVNQEAMCQKTIYEWTVSRNSVNGK